MPERVQIGRQAQALIHVAHGLIQRAMTEPPHCLRPTRGNGVTGGNSLHFGLLLPLFPRYFLGLCFGVTG